jgi:cellulose synthase/poly-beta-1,6-N-acetylglucosamine synthase-like glycosyltransferase
MFFLPKNEFTSRDVYGKEDNSPQVIVSCSVFCWNNDACFQSIAEKQSFSSMNNFKRGLTQLYANIFVLNFSFLDCISKKYPSTIVTIKRYIIGGTKYT